MAEKISALEITRSKCQKKLICFRSFKCPRKKITSEESRRWISTLLMYRSHNLLQQMKLFTFLIQFDSLAAWLLQYWIKTLWNDDRHNLCICLRKSKSSYDVMKKIPGDLIFPALQFHGIILFHLLPHSFHSHSIRCA
jgi:hypothetical protein